MLRKSTEIGSVWVEDPVYMTLRRSFLCLRLVGFYNHLAPDGALPRNNPRRGGMSIELGQRQNSKLCQVYDLVEERHVMGWCVT